MPRRPRWSMQAIFVLRWPGLRSLLRSVTYSRLVCLKLTHSFGAYRRKGPVPIWASAVGLNPP